MAATDVPVIQIMLSALMDAARGVEPELSRRFLAIVIRGLSADPGSAEALTPGPLLPRDVDLVMSRSKGSTH